MASEKPLNHKLIKKLIHSDKIEALRDLLNELDTVEIANSLLQLKLEHQSIVLESLSKDSASEVLTNLQYHSPILSEIVSTMNTQKLGEIIEEMAGDDATDIVSLLNEEKADEVLENLSSKDRQEITTLMQYDQESAGGIMTPDVGSVLKDQTIDQAIQSIRAYIEQEEMGNFYAVYVTDEYQHLIGMVSLPQLLLSNRNTLISELMNPNVVAVDVDMDQEDVARISQEYNLVVVPVIDKYLKLIGRITCDDVMHVLQDEYHEDMAHIAGTGSEEVLETSVIRTSRDRLPWLILGLFGGVLVASAMSGYEKIFTQLPQIMYFIPLMLNEFTSRTIIH